MLGASVQRVARAAPTSWDVSDRGAGAHTTEKFETSEVPGHRMVVEVALHHASQPLAEFLPLAGASVVEAPPSAL